jgi:hypothetical protein
MKLDPGIHIGMHLVCFSKTRCTAHRRAVKTEEVRQGRPAPGVLGAWRQEESASPVPTTVSIR